MIYLVSGENVYGCDLRLKKLINDSLANDSAPSSIDMSESDSLAVLASKLQGSSLFSESETLIVRYLEDEKTIQEKALKLIADCPDGNTVIVFVPGTKPSNPLIKKLTKIAGKTFMEGMLNEYELAKWVNAETIKRGGKVNMAAARTLVDVVGFDQMSLSNEIDKLVAYDRNITKDNIRKVAVPSPRTTIFEMLDVMMQGRTENAISYLSDLKAQQFDEMYIMSMIAWQAHALTVAVATKGQNQTEAAKKTGVSPYVLKKAAGIARNLSKQDIIKLNQYILEADVELKTAPTDKEQLVEQLLRRVAFIQS